MNCPRKRQTNNELLTTSWNYYNFTMVANQSLKGTWLIIWNGLGRWFCLVLVDGGVGFRWRVRSIIRNGSLAFCSNKISNRVLRNTFPDRRTRHRCLWVGVHHQTTEITENIGRQHQSAKLNVIQLLYIVGGSSESIHPSHEEEARNRIQWQKLTTSDL